MKKILQLLLVTLIVSTSALNLQGKCIPYASRGASWSFSNKDCTYTFVANKLKDSSCFYFAWYQGKKLLGTGSTYTTTFLTSDSSAFSLRIINICDSTCSDTIITKIVSYKCAPKCNWKDRKAGLGYSKKDCVYNFEANNLKDSCISYTWMSAGKVLGTGRLLTYKFLNSKAEICLKIKDSCKGCDTIICQTLYDSCGTTSKCKWSAKKPGFTYGNKDCVYTFEANNLKDSCIKYVWYKGKDLIDTGRILKLTFTTNGYSDICLKIIDTCQKCDTSICETIKYNCGSKCNWKDRKAGWGYSKKGCAYTFEATNLKDSCVSYTWMSAGKVLGTGRLLTYKFTNSKAEICLKIKDTCKGCDTIICKTLYDSCTASIQDFNHFKTNIKIHPNPSSTGFEALFLQGVPTEINIFDLIGNEINCPKQVLDNITYFDTKNIADGIYLIRIKMGNISTTQKIVVRH